MRNFSRGEKIKLKKTNVSKKIDGIEDLKEITINSNSTSRTLEDLSNDKKLDINPFFQRNYVWNDRKASALVESLIMQMPVPEIFSFIDPETDKEMIIDGQQRITSVLNYMKNKFSLSGLTHLSFLNGFSFFELPKQYKTKIERACLRFYRIDNINDKKVVFEIFRRFNTGSMNLKPQEIRNCIYNGKYNDLINELANQKDFKELFIKEGKISRMQEAEFVLRFLAFYHEADRYKSQVHRFLDEYMEGNVEIFENLNSEKLSREKNRCCSLFNKSFSICKQVFGGQIFKSCNINFDKKGKKRFTWGPVSTAVYDTQMLGFSDYELREVIEYSDSIKEAFINLALNDPNFLPMSNSNSKQVAKYRLNKWKSELSQIIGYKKKTRSFSIKLKQELFKKDPTCSRCGQQIQSINDSQVDHHKPYWRGGETIPENARLMHRFCNQSKGKS